MTTDFPRFMRNKKNAVDPSMQSKGNIGYLFDGKDGSQMAVWTCHEANVSKEHVHEYDEYFTVVHGEYILIINGKRIIMKPGDEYHIKKGIPHSGEAVKGTRTIYAFGGIRAKRAGEH